MRRRWFGVFLALFSSISTLLVVIPATPTYAASGIGCPSGPLGPPSPTANYPCPEGGAVINGVYTAETLLGCPGRPLAPITANYTCLSGGQVINGAYSPPNALGCPGNPPAPITANYVCPGGGSVVNGVYFAPGAVPGAVGSDTTAAVKCDGGQLFTWIVCGVIEFFVGPNGIVDAIRDNAIVPFLEAKPLTSDSPVYAIWASFRNVASIFFILVFFLVILGTALGFDNYTIKKIMPRLVAGAILVPFSWYLCVFVIDIGNVVGKGLPVLMDSVIGDVPIDITTNWTDYFGLGAATVGGGFALYAGAAAMGLAGVISLLIALAGVFLTLIMRQILIMLFVVLSPFALLAWILPNTEKWFKTWWQNLFKLVMMYPIIMLLFEAGRLFAKVAGATVPGGGAAPGTVAANVTPLIQILALVLPLFLVPFAFKLAGSGLSMAGGAIGKFGGGLDKRYGKSSESAKQAAQNRELRNLQRGKNMDPKIASASGLEKRRLQAAQRFYNRRAGHAMPLNGKQKGLFSNPAALLAHEAAYGKVMGQQGVLDANDLNKKDGVASESHEQRRQAEGLAAQQKKIGDRAGRLALVANAKELGDDKLAEHNRAILDAGVNKGLESQAEKGGNALGVVKQAANNPLSALQIADHSQKLGEASEAERRQVVKDEVEMHDVMDEKALKDFNNGKPPAQHIDIERAHQMRMNNLAEAAGRNAGNKIIGRDIDATVSNTASHELTDTEIARSIAAGNGPISHGQALLNRLDQGVKAGVSQGVVSKIAEEGKDYTYNEMEEKAGGRLKTTDILAGTRLNNRQAMADDRNKIIGAVVAGTNPNGTDKVSSAQINQASLHQNVKTIGDQVGATQGVLEGATNEARLDGAVVGSVAALQGAASRSTDASRITKGRQAAEQLGVQAGTIRGDQAAFQKAQLQATKIAGAAAPTAEAVRAQTLARATTANTVTSARSEITKVAQDQGVVTDAKANPTSLSTVYDAGLKNAISDAAAKTGNIRATAKAFEAEALTGRTTPDTEGAALHAAHEVAAATEIHKIEQLGNDIGHERAIIDQNDKAPVTADQYIQTSRDQTARNLVGKASETLGSAAQLETDVSAEMATNGGNRLAAETAVRGRRLDNVQKSGLLQGEIKAQQSVDTEASVATATETGINLEADRLELEESAKAANNPSYIPRTRDALRATARQNITTGAGITAGSAAGKRQSQDIGANLADKDVYDREVGKRINAGATPEAAAEAVQLERLQNAGKAARDLTARRTQEQYNADAGTVNGIDTEIANATPDELEEGAEGPAMPRAAVEKNVFNQNMERAGQVAKIKATNERMNSTARDKGITESFEADADIVQTEAHDRALVEQKEAGRAAKQKVIDDAKSAKRGEIRDQAYNDALNDYQTREANNALSSDERALSAEQFARKAANTKLEDSQKEIKKATKAKPVKQAANQARKDAEADISVPPTLSRSQAEREIFTAGARAAQETIMRSESSAHAVRAALSEASQSPQAKTAKERINIAKTPALEREADEVANQEAQSTLIRRPYDKIVNDAKKVKTQDVIIRRAKEEGKNTLDDLGPEYKEAVISEMGNNPFGNLPLDEVEMSNGPLEGLQIIFKKAVQNKDWPKAMAAIQKISTSNGGYEKAKELQMTPVSQGGLGARKWNTVDENDPNASYLKFIWDNGASVGAKSNTDQNKPIHVAARDFDVPKLASTNDKQMSRYFDWYQSRGEVETAKKQLEANINSLAPSERTGENYENMLYQLSEFESYEHLRQEGIRDINKTVPDVFASSGKGGAQKGFSTATLKSMLKQVERDYEGKYGGRKPGEDPVFTPEVADMIRKAAAGTPVAPATAPSEESTET